MEDITLRDQFAMAALAACRKRIDAREAATTAYDIADAMIEERERDYQESDEVDGFEPKYKFTDKTRNHFGERRLYQIVALRSFDDVKEGDIGGWIESEDNLSHDGNCWVYRDAWAFGEARVFGNGKVYSDGIVNTDDIIDN